jgi:hypothetical protein
VRARTTLSIRTLVFLTPNFRVLHPAFDRLKTLTIAPDTVSHPAVRSR